LSIALCCCWVVTRRAGLRATPGCPKAPRLPTTAPCAHQVVHDVRFPTPRCFVFRTPPGPPGNPCARLLRCCPSNSLPDTRSPCIAAGRKSLTPLPGLLDRLCVRRLATCDLLISFSLDAIRIPVKPAGTECTPFLMLRQEFDASNSKPRDVPRGYVASTRFFQSLGNDTDRRAVVQGQIPANSFCPFTKPNRPGAG